MGLPKGALVPTTLPRQDCFAKLDEIRNPRSFTAMATYIYETVPQDKEEQPHRFEWQQSMKDAPLSSHPETGQPVRRVITGGYGFSVAGKASSPAPAPAQSGGCCGGACGCSHN